MPERSERNSRNEVVEGRFRSSVRPGGEEGEGEVDDEGGTVAAEEGWGSVKSKVVDLLTETTMRTTEVGLVSGSEGKFAVVGGGEGRVDLLGRQDFRLVLLEEPFAFTGERERRCSGGSSFLDGRRRRRGDLDVGNGNGPFSELNWRHHISPPFSLVAVIDLNSSDNPSPHPLLHRLPGVVRFNLAARVSPDVMKKRVLPAGVESKPRVRDAVDEGRVEDEELSSSDSGRNRFSSEDG